MDSVFCFDNFELDCGAFTLRHLGEPVRINVLVLRVLEALVRNSGRVLSKDRLIAEVWDGRVVTDNALSVAVARLRRLFRDSGMPRESIMTAHGYGYRFTRDVSSRERVLDRESPTAPYDAELVGRDHVMLQLKAALALTHSGRGSLAALLGEAGIGKTRVAEAFAAYAVREGCVVAWASCGEPGSKPPLGTFLELLRTVESAALDAQPPELAALLSERASDADHVGRNPAWLYESESRHDVFGAIANLLCGESEGPPRVLILDDLLCADEATLQLLSYLLPTLGRMRLLIVATLRGAACDAETDPTLKAALVHRNCLRITLGPLSRFDVKGYIDACHGAVEPTLSARIYELSGGNPYSMCELVQQLRDGRAWNAAGLSVPELTRERVLQRLSALDADARDTLAYAAALRGPFGLPLLAAIVQRPASALMLTLDRASVAGIVHTVEESRTEFAFTHELLRAALYDEQSPIERRMRHRRIARTLEERRALAELSGAELAYHVRCWLPKGDWRNSAERCLEAASMRDEMFVLASATRYIKGALDVLSNARACECLGSRDHDTLPICSELSPLSGLSLRVVRELDGALRAVAQALGAPLPGLLESPAKDCTRTDSFAAPLQAAPQLRSLLASALPARRWEPHCHACRLELLRHMTRLRAVLATDSSSNTAGHHGLLELHRWMSARRTTSIPHSETACGSGTRVVHLPIKRDSASLSAVSSVPML